METDSQFLYVNVD